MAAKKKYDRTKQKETLKKVLEYIEQYRAVLVFSLILAAVTVACTLYLPNFNRRCNQPDFGT